MLTPVLTGSVCPFFTLGCFTFCESTPGSLSGTSFSTPCSMSSCLVRLIDIFLSSSSDVSWNLSLLFFLRHFQGLKIFPRVENLVLRFGVLSPVLPPSPTIVPWCCSASSSRFSITEFEAHQSSLDRCRKSWVAWVCPEPEKWDSRFLRSPT